MVGGLRPEGAQVRWNLPAQRPVVWTGPEVGNGRPAPGTGFVTAYRDLGQGLTPRRNLALTRPRPVWRRSNKRESVPFRAVAGELVRPSVRGPFARGGSGRAPQGPGPGDCLPEQSAHRRHLWVRPGAPRARSNVGPEWRGLGTLPGAQARTGLLASVPVCEMGGAGRPSGAGSSQPELRTHGRAPAEAKRSRPRPGEPRALLPHRVLGPPDPAARRWSIR